MSLRQYTPPAAVVNPKGEILYVNGRTGRSLEPVPGLSSMNIFDMVREELNHELSGAVHQAVATRQPVVADNVKLHLDTGVQLVHFTVKALEESEQMNGLLLVVFKEQPTSRQVRRSKIEAGPGSDAQVQALGRELQHTKHRLQTIIGEMESRREELKSTNKELQRATEELQSTN